MRKFSVLTVILLLFSVSMSQANLLNDPGFETNTQWTVNNDATWGWWSARSVSNGVAFNGWNPGTGEIYQAVSATQTGLYSFTIWSQKRHNVDITNLEVKIEFWDAGLASKVQADTMVNYATVPGDDLWHLLKVSGVATSPSLGNVRAVVSGTWNPPLGGGSDVLMFDDAVLVQGESPGSLYLESGSFEEGLPDDWHLGKWSSSTLDQRFGRRDWGDRSGAWGVALFGWDEGSGFEMHGAQPVYPGTGTYTFVIWSSREQNFLLTNAELRLEFYDSSLTNKVCPDAISSITVSNDNVWREYSVTGTCNNAALWEVRPVILYEWDGNTNPVASKAARVDDARFLHGIYDGSSLQEDWTYHNAAGKKSSLEQVPGTNVGAFLQVDYASSNMMFYVLADPDAALYGDEGSDVSLRMSWQKPDTLAWTNLYVMMTRVGTVTVGTGGFHGMPAAGSKMLDLWSYTQGFPRDDSNILYTNQIPLYYAPYLRSTNGVQETDRRYLVASGTDTTTNNLAQLFADAPEGRDYSVTLNPVRHATLQNADFETPLANDFANAFWGTYGNIARADWAAYEGERGAYFASWTAGGGGLYQDVSATESNYTFSIFVKRMLGAAVNTLDIKLEWYNTAMQNVHVDTLSAASIPADERWHRVYVNSTYTNADALTVRPVVAAGWNAGTHPFHEAVILDNAELYSGGFTGVHELANASFEIGTNAFHGGYWDPVVSDWVSKESWAAKSGAWGGGFKGYLTNNLTYTGALSQGLNISTGTYQFAVWMQAEDAIDLTNTELRIEWLDRNFNKVQPDSVTNITVPKDYVWRQYSVVGTCTDVELFEVRPVVLAQWHRNEAPGNKSLKVDDAFFGAPGLGDTDGDGIPDWWEMKYFGGITNADAQSNGDADPASNGEEWIADTIPTNGGSYFDNSITNLDGFGVIVLQAGPPTTNSRVYDVWSRDRVTGGGAWIPMKYDIPGAPNGGAVTFAITNVALKSFYRTGVKLP
ncbi:MAG: hypothetical protein KJ626_09400 [Verrucomicrobia bacterium]|nr:hypothetical protein [Verrucomicrobiota bacterium]